MRDDKIVGFLCGFFDLIHAGHIDILRQAKEQCDYLIVGVGTDDFIKIRKNRESILSYEQRVEIVKSIKYVDEVVPENDLDKISAFYKYRFDIMFAGEDHLTEPVYVDATKKLHEMGVKTVYIPRKINCSSTAVRNRIVNLFCN